MVCSSYFARLDKSGDYSGLRFWIAHFISLWCFKHGYEKDKSLKSMLSQGCWKKRLRGVLCFLPSLLVPACVMFDVEIYVHTSNYWTVFNGLERFFSESQTIKKGDWRVCLGITFEDFFQLLKLKEGKTYLTENCFFFIFVFWLFSKVIFSKNIFFWMFYVHYLKKFASCDIILFLYIKYF